MKRIIVASNNAHKVKEIKHILNEYPVEVISLKEAGIDIDVEEVGTTFMENAELKAREIYKVAKGSMILADDSGLAVDILGGKPGIYSARYAGEHGDSKKNNEKLLEELKGKTLEERSAKFICAMVLIVSEDQVIKVQGEVEGFITEEQSGVEGFGYDPLFYVPEIGATFAQMTAHMKNTISHRAMALDKLKEELDKIAL